MANGTMYSHGAVEAMRAELLAQQESAIESLLRAHAEEIARARAEGEVLAAEARVEADAARAAVARAERERVQAEVEAAREEAERQAERARALEVVRVTLEEERDRASVEHGEQIRSLGDEIALLRASQAKTATILLDREGQIHVLRAEVDRQGAEEIVRVEQIRALQEERSRTLARLQDIASRLGYEGTEALLAGSVEPPALAGRREHPERQAEPVIEPVDGETGVRRRVRAGVSAPRSDRRSLP